MPSQQTSHGGRAHSVNMYSGFHRGGLSGSAYGGSLLQWDLWLRVPTLAPTSFNGSLGGQTGSESSSACKTDIFGDPEDASAEDGAKVSRDGG